MKRIEQVWTSFKLGPGPGLKVGVLLFMFNFITVNFSVADEISEGCNETLTDLTHTLRSCDVVIGRRNTDLATRIRAFQVRGKTHLAVGNIRAAMADFTSALSALPDGRLKGYVLYLRGQSRFDYAKRTDGVINASLDDLENANALAPANPRILETLARIYLIADRPEDAIRTANSAVENDPRALDARKSRAQAFEATGRNREAISDLNALLERRIGDPDLLAWRGRLHEKRRNVKQALADYRNAARRKTTQQLLDGIKRMERVLGE
jgi:tetratricopeptide (TPR) repeat protein